MTDRWIDVQLWFFRRYWGFLSRRMRWVYDWHIDYGHPVAQPWAGYPDSHMGPRHEWVCRLGDWLTAGWLHD